jgi:hypothetical protein
MRMNSLSFAVISHPRSPHILVILTRMETAARAALRPQPGRGACLEVVLKPERLLVPLHRLLERGHGPVELPHLHGGRAGGEDAVGGAGSIHRLETHTFVHHLTPSCSTLHHLTPSCSTLHHLTPSYTNLQHLAAPCTIRVPSQWGNSRERGGADVAVLGKEAQRHLLAGPVSAPRPAPPVTGATPTPLGLRQRSTTPPHRPTPPPRAIHGAESWVS